MYREFAWDVIRRALALSVFLDTAPARRRWDDDRPQYPEPRGDLPAESAGERR